VMLEPRRHPESRLGHLARRLLIGCAYDGHSAMGARLPIRIGKIDRSELPDGHVSRPADVSRKQGYNGHDVTSQARVSVEVDLDLALVGMLQCKCDPMQKLLSAQPPLSRGVPKKQSLSVTSPAEYFSMTCRAIIAIVLCDKRHRIDHRQKARGTSCTYGGCRSSSLMLCGSGAVPGSPQVHQPRTRTASLNRAHSMAPQISVWACPKVRISAATCAAVARSGASKMSR